MAHGDYDCCAVCDSKLSYNGFAATTKEEICSYCAVALAQVGVIARSGEEFVRWIKDTDITTISEKLKACSVKECFYSNSVDEALKEKGYFDENNQ